jgi:hypothetical protein
LQGLAWWDYEEILVKNQQAKNKPLWRMMPGVPVVPQAGVGTPGTWIMAVYEGAALE